MPELLSVERIVILPEPGDRAAVLDAAARLLAERFADPAFRAHLREAANVDALRRCLLDRGPSSDA